MDRNQINKNDYELGKEYYEISISFNFEQDKIIKYCNKKNLDLTFFKHMLNLYFIVNHLEIFSLSEKEGVFIFGKNTYKTILTFKNLIPEILNSFSFYYLWDNPSHVIHNYLFDFFQKVQFDKNLILKKLQKLDIDFEEACEIMAKYALNTAKWPEDKVRQCFSHLINKSFYTTTSILEQILHISDQTEINQLIENSVQDYLYIKDQIHSFLIQNYKDDYDLLKIILERKLQNYQNYLHEKKLIAEQQLKIENRKLEIKNNIDIASNIIRAYIGSTFRTKEDFCNFNHLDLKLFDFYLSIVKEGDTNLHDLYTAKKNAIAKQNYAILMTVVNNILNALKNGIVINNKTRPFDLLDYFRMTTLERSQTLKFIKDNDNFSESDYRLFITFLRKYSNAKLLKPRDIEKLLNEKNLSGVVFDEKGFPIPNTGREITIEEKLLIINYLNSKHIPLYDTIYYIALKRYEDGELVFDINENEVNNSKKLN